MKLLFIRHGKAEDKQPNMSDSERHLTQEGRQDLEKEMGYLRNYLKAGSFKIFSSPLVRAIETAQYLNHENVEKEFLSTGNREELVACVDEYHAFDYLVFVGHEPFISQWILDLCQTRLDVKKGMLIECEYPFQFIRAVKLKDYSNL